MTENTGMHAGPPSYDRYTWDDERLFRNGEYIAALESVNADEDDHGSFGRYVASVLTDYPRQVADHQEHIARLRKEHDREIRDLEREARAEIRDAGSNVYGGGQW